MDLDFLTRAGLEEWPATFDNGSRGRGNLGVRQARDRSLGSQPASARAGRVSPPKLAAKSPDSVGSPGMVSRKAKA
jgi:hypothetical protein